MKRKRVFSIRTVLLVICIIELGVFLFGPFGMSSNQKSPMDYIFLLLILVHSGWFLYFRKKKQKTLYRLLFRVPEILFAVTAVLFLFSYIYASNANMDYVQRFAATSGNIRLAPDSTIERLNSLLRYVPFLFINGLFILYFRLKQRQFLVRESGITSFFSIWGLPSALISAFCYTIALPSFVRLDGMPVLAWICLTPLFLTLRTSSRFWAIMYGVFFGVIQTMLANYWLGTFSLVSLQFITILYLLLYFLFMTVLVHLLQNTGRWSMLILPAGWVLFDYLRSLAFLGYPWAMLGVSQYAFLPLIQISSVTGVWGVSFIVYAANAVWTECILQKDKRKILWPVVIYTGMTAVIILAGSVYLIAVKDRRGTEKTESVKVALIQQNTDPRKDDYREGLNALIKLTDEALIYKPDLVAWSETAFVPNIRRWSQVDPNTNYYAKLVKDLLDYLKTIHTWLITGNDDYTLSTDKSGAQIRNDFNASILFSDKGERVQTYHKMHLVPFTEYFPYRKQMPWMYNLLLNFDVNLWTPGTRRLVFHHPLFTFSTPICFEDSFPNDVRGFVRAGAQVILNLSNDFWSLTKVEAKQHFVNALFRAVENRRQMLRATASGVTAHIDPQGRVVKRLPYYEEGYLIADVHIGKPRTTLYTRFGDWFPMLCLGIILFAFLRTALNVLRKYPGSQTESPERSPKE